MNALFLAGVIALASTSSPIADRVLRVASVDCMGVVVDLMPAIRDAGVIRVNGDVVVVRGAADRPRIDHRRLEALCPSAGAAVEIRVAQN